MNISVVIPTYRRPELLARCLDALMHQTLPPEQFEIVVVSDGPDYETSVLYQAVAKTHRTRALKFLSTHSRRGPAAARNVGWKNSRGQLIAFTDDDCIPDPGWLAALWNAFIMTGTPVVAFTGRTIVPTSSPPTDYELNISNLERAEFITANCACTRRALERVGGFDEHFTMAWREDTSLHFAFLQHEIPICRIPEAIVTHPVRKHPWAISLKEEKKGIFNVLLYKKYPELYKSKIDRHIPLNYYLIDLCLLLTLCGLLVRIDWLALVSFGGWLLLTLSFVFKRLRRTTHSPRHVAEMLVTSVAIPILATYYRWYGSIKYGVLLP
jgi:glycosyltransferase involved in cell wall biosynthesis